MIQRFRLGWRGEGDKAISESEQNEIRFEQEYIDFLEDLFPKLKGEGYCPTSEKSDRPNCIGWALYDKNQYWDPDLIGVKGYYWPPGVPRTHTLNSWTKVFELHGYRICRHSELEPGFEKVALYVTPGTNIPEHVARQKASGKWVSKLGTGADIEHNTLNGLSGDFYGVPVRYMKRPRLPGAE
ncbi:MAG: hypothetical protein WB763_01800 [Terriglobia bacterium]